MKSRIRAFLIHFAASIMLALASMAVIFFLWYPSPLGRAVGVTELFLILLMVDVIIGPLLTLLVYKVGKPSLRFDLVSIICLQFAAFVYGFWTVAEGRPAWIVFSADRFDLVQVYQIDTRKQDQALAEYRNPSWTGAKWAYAPRPANQEQRQTILFEALIAGVDLAQRPDLYRGLHEAAEEMKKHAQPLADLKEYNAWEEVDSVLAQWPEADAFLPMMARVRPLTVLINKSSAKVVAIVDLNPWL